VTGIGQISLRERKYARTKLALLDAAVKRMLDRPFDSISVRELCDEAMVSEATFFNYFPKKSDLLVYFVQLWSIDVAWHGRQTSKGTGGLTAIEAVFDRTAERASKRPRVMSEIIAFIAREQDAAVFKPISLAERLMAYPELDLVDDLPADGFEALVGRNLEVAVEMGELPAATDVLQTRVHLEAAFFGIPLVLGVAGAAKLKETYRQALQLVWAGIRSGQ
jgi:AcrR family transcriptional regulator